MMRNILIPLLFLGYFSSLAARADDTAELKQQLDWMNQSEPYVEAPEQSQFRFLKSLTQHAIDLFSKEGEIFSKAEAMRKLIFHYHFSRSFQNRIATPATDEALKKAWEAIDLLAKKHRYAEHLRITLTEMTFRQLHTLFRDLLRMEIPEALKTDISSLLDDIGRTAAQGMTGDNQQTYAAAAPVCAKIRSLYPKFRDLRTLKTPSPASVLDIVEEIKGLTELYVYDYARIGSLLDTPEK